jgi:hypothetical protein
MPRWLVEEEQTFKPAALGAYATRSSRAKATYSLLLRGLKVLDNKKFWGASDINVVSVVVDGYPDMKTGRPFWAQEMKFSGVRDGALLSIDPDMGQLIYRGRPKDFLNLYLLVVRDTGATAGFAKLLQKNFLAEGIGTVAGAAVSIFAGMAAPVAASAARDMATRAVNATLDYYAKRKELLVGTYYGSLIGEMDYGRGVHPQGFPGSMIPAGGALELAYEVRR